MENGVNDWNKETLSIRCAVERLELRIGHERVERL